jgi:hypothetical protein
MNRILLVHLLALAAVPTTNARLFETRPELEAKYGQPIKVENHAYGKLYTYNYKRFRVLVTFLDGKSQSELYVRADGKRLVPVEVLKLSAMNSLGNTWTTGNGMFVLVNPSTRGHPIAVSACYPDNTAYPLSLHICTADFVKKFGTAPPNGKTLQH